MSIQTEKAFQLNGVTSNFCMKLAGNSTVAVLALIQIRKTKNRAPPPACGNGFETAYLAFAKGHVVALELGGSDHPGNVVPQFEHWQGKPNGAWRQMELALMAHPGKLMLVEIGYGRTGGQQSFQKMRSDFEADRLMDWTDERIPDAFSVSVWPRAGVDPGAIGSDQAFNEALVRLRQSGAAFSQEFQLGNAMPQPDRSMYIGQEAITIANDLYDRQVPPLQRTLTPLTWLLQEDTIKAVRLELGSVPSVKPPEATGFQLQTLIYDMHATTPSKVKKKRQEGVNQGLRMVDEEQTKKRRLG